MRVLLNGRGGRVGSVLGPGLEAAGHTLVGSLDDAQAMVDFTRPEAAAANIRAAVSRGVPSVIGTTGWDTSEFEGAPVTVFYAPNFALGAVLMMRFAEEAARHMQQAEIVELHHPAKLDAPSGTARLTAERMGGGVPIHSVRLPGLTAHQEVILGAPGEVLTIRHDATSHDAYTPGVLLALERLASLPPGLTVGLDALL
ncbi:MAG TPA: dihydrodipicolinate reductase C-terminal domain-containing protein [Gaiellaceae bacterium]|nr:dihydrodipicolinate reductase C-terminal domain-containing protein [Gaiellaceae bacterium]